MAPIVMPLHRLMGWSPFRLDALGLVTLIGAEEVNQAVGRLVGSGYTTFLPLLGQYLISGNLFTTSVPGFTLYNLTDAFTTTSLSGWFSRWLKSQDLKTSITAFEWTVLSEDKRLGENHMASLCIGCFTVTFMIVMTILMGDWWGVSNSIALGVSVYVRWFVVRENTVSLDKTCGTVCSAKTSYNATRLTLLVTLDDGKLVTVYAPRGLVMGGFLKKPVPAHPSLYTWTRMVGWGFFGIHVISLGQCDLTTQILTVVVLIGSTWLVVRGFGCNDCEIGKAIRVQRVPDSFPLPDRRMWAYARLQPTFDEEGCLTNWNLLPRKVSTDWWKEFEMAKQALKRQSEKSPGFSPSVSNTNSQLSVSSRLSATKPAVDV